MTETLRLKPSLREATQHTMKMKKRKGKRWGSSRQSPPARLALRHSTVVPNLAMPIPDGIALLVTEDKGVGTLQDFAGEDEVSIALLDF